MHWWSCGADTSPALPHVCKRCCAGTRTWLAALLRDMRTVLKVERSVAVTSPYTGLEGRVSGEQPCFRWCHFSPTPRAAISRPLGTVGNKKRRAWLFKSPRCGRDGGDFSLAGGPEFGARSTSGPDTA